MRISSLFRRWTHAALAALLLGMFASGAWANAAVIPNVIPLPAQFDRQAGSFTLSAATRIVTEGPAGAAEVASYFAGLVERTCGITLSVQSRSAGSDEAIRLVLDPRQLSAPGGAEAYTLDISPRGIVIRAGDVRGLFYGAVTLWQLLTEHRTSQKTRQIAAAHIEDGPVFAWRGFMLDSARHFMPPQFIRSLLDWMALHKLNTFHWHLTDDQGWRIQIRRYPRLTQVGSHGVSDGFYTQAEIRNIVRYAAQRHITVVPEIEMPGHAQAAIAAYPELGTGGATPKVSRDWGVHDYLFNVDDATFVFLENVLGEVMALFPGPYIHIGGDEATKTRWHGSAAVQQRMHLLGVKDEAALQGYFVQRIESYLRAHGRRLIGWDEILEADVPAQATIMSWRGGSGAAQAAAAGHDVVLAPAPQLYLDYLQSDAADEPPGRPSYQRLEDVYAFEPRGPRVLGAQVNAWSEHMRTPQRIEHAAFPRSAALAEVLWTPARLRSWDSFVERLPAQFDRYRSLGIDFADSAFAVRIAAAPLGAARARIELSTQVAAAQIHYTLDAAEPTLNSPRYARPFDAATPAMVRAVSFLQGRPMAAVRSRSLDRAHFNHRSDDELRSCHGKLPLRLEDDGPATGERAVFNIDILDPCWIFAAAELSGVHAISAEVGQLPFNFQVGDAVRDIALIAPHSPAGELEVRLDGCDGERIASLPLAGASAATGVTTLPAVALDARSGPHDLCLYFTRRTLTPMWALKGVQLIE